MKRREDWSETHRSRWNVAKKLWTLLNLFGGAATLLVLSGFYFLCPQGFTAVGPECYEVSKHALGTLLPMVQSWGWNVTILTTGIADAAIGIMVWRR